MAHYIFTEKFTYLFYFICIAYSISNLSNMIKKLVHWVPTNLLRNFFFSILKIQKIISNKCLQKTIYFF